jgi:type IV fimbrial biogenesis protein FimT
MRSLAPRGITLLELLMTIAVAGIVAGVGAPWWTRIIAGNERLAATNQLVGLIQRARSEAIKSGKEVVLCPDNGTGGCLDGDGAWSNGYTLFLNAQRGRPWRPDDAGGLLARGRWPGQISVHGNRDGWVFRPLALRSTNGTFRICHRRNLTPPRAVIVSPMGRPRTAQRLPGGGTIPCPDT